MRKKHRDSIRRDHSEDQRMQNHRPEEERCFGLAGRHCQRRLAGRRDYCCRWWGERLLLGSSGCRCGRVCRPGLQGRRSRTAWRGLSVRMLVRHRQSRCRGGSRHWRALAVRPARNRRCWRQRRRQGGFRVRSEFVPCKVPLVRYLSGGKGKDGRTRWQRAARHRQRIDPARQTAPAACGKQMPGWTSPQAAGRGVAAGGTGSST